MSKETTSPRPVIKSLGRRSGNLSSAELKAVVREVRNQLAVKKIKVLKKEDTATGAGHVRFKKIRAGSEAKPPRSAA